MRNRIAVVESQLSSHKVFESSQSYLKIFDETSHDSV